MSQRRTTPDARRQERHQESERAPHGTRRTTVQQRSHTNRINTDRPTRHRPSSQTTADGQVRRGNRPRTQARTAPARTPSRVQSQNQSQNQYQSQSPYQDQERTRRARSVGAATLAAPRTRSFGMPSPDTRRRYGRGETVRRVEEERLGSVYARPAVFTAEPRHRSVLSTRMPAFAIPVAVIAAILLAIIMLFGPVRTYYAAWRDSGRLEAEYEALSQQNAELMEQLDRLQSLDGIEDEARRRGYAYPDEEVLIVDGLEEEKLADPAKVEAAVESHEEMQPWYVNFLDNLLGYKRSAQET